MRGITFLGLRPKPPAAASGDPFAPRRTRRGPPCGALPSWGCAPNPRRPLAGTPSPRAAPAEARRAGLVSHRPRRGSPAAGCCSIHADGRRRSECAERPDTAHAVPRIEIARRLALALVPLEEARHEELLRQGRQHHAAGVAVVDDAVGVIRIHHLQHGPRLRRVVRNLVSLVGTADGTGRQPHQRIAVGRRHVLRRRAVPRSRTCSTAG